VVSTAEEKLEIHERTWKATAKKFDFALFLVLP